MGSRSAFAVKTGGPLVAAAQKLNKATDEAVRDDIAALPGMVQRVDDWIAEGVMGDEQLNAADLQIGASLRLAMTMDDIRPAIEGRPAGELAMRAFPDYPGRVPPVFPADWLEPLRRPAAA